MFGAVYSLCVLRALQNEDVAANLTLIAHHHFIQGYFENDKLIFSLLLALEVCNANTIHIMFLFLYLCSLRPLKGEFLRMNKSFWYHHFLVPSSVAWYINNAHQRMQQCLTLASDLLIGWQKNNGKVYWYVPFCVICVLLCVMWLV